MIGAVSYITCPQGAVCVVPRHVTRNAARAPCVCCRTDRTDPQRPFCVPCRFRIEDSDVLETIAIVLLILWALGLVSSYSMGGLIHILLVVAIIMILVRVIQGRRI